MVLSWCGCATSGRPPSPSIYKYFEGDEKLSAEFLALDREPISATRDGRPIWKVDKPVIQFTSLDGPTPATSKSRRELQLRALGRRFSATITDYADDKTVRRLRLLSRPLLSYSSPEDQTHGAIFAFVVATDPDVLLLIESTEKNGMRTWEYAVGRLSINASRVQLDDKLVWKVAEHESPYERPREGYSIWDAIGQSTLSP